MKNSVSNPQAQLKEKLYRIKTQHDESASIFSTIEDIDRELLY